MNQNHLETLTHHATLMVWGQFAQSMGLIDKIQSVRLHQKSVEYGPQGKVLQFLLAILAGLEHLQNLSRSAHPIDQDWAVAKACQQAGWADYSGGSRTLSGLTQAEAEQIVDVVEQIPRSILAEEVMCTLQSTGAYPDPREPTVSLPTSGVVPSS